MANPTEAELKAAARKALAAGDTAAAKRLIDAARKAGAAAPPAPVVAPTAPQDLEALYGALEARPTQAPAVPQGNFAADTSALVQPQPGIMGDVGASFGSGLLRGGAGLIDFAKEGLPGAQIGNIIEQGAAGLKAAGLLGDTAGADRMAQAISPPENLGKNSVGLLSMGASEYAPQTTAGEYASTIAEFLPSAALGGGGVGGLIKYGVIPALASETAGQATEGTSVEPFARAGAAMLAPAALGLMGRAISPFGSADAERLKLAGVLEKFGVPVTAGQKTGSDVLRKAEGGTFGGAKIDEAQSEAFTSAVLKTAGIDAKRATPEVLDEAFTRIGKVFDDVTAGVDVTPDAEALTKLSGAVNTFKELAPKGSAPPIFENINKAFLQAFRSGKPIAASTLKVWRSNLSKLTTSADTATRSAAIDALDAVDDAMTAGLIAVGKGTAVKALDVARGQYRNLLAIENAAGRAGENARLGVISPQAVRSALVQQGKRSFTSGKRKDLGDLARAAEAVMSPLPTVTAGGRRAIEGLASLGMGAAGMSAMGPYGLLAAALPTVAKEAMMTRPVQAYLGNQAVNAPINAGKGLYTIPGLLAQ